VAAAGGAPRQLTSALRGGAPRWSRDGRWIYFVADRRDRPWFGPEDEDLYAVAADLAKPTDGAALRP